ncbi:hypothetical protein ACQJBY_035586 [Aegilops geniculata]
MKPMRVGGRCCVLIHGVVRVHYCFQPHPLWRLAAASENGCRRKIIVAVEESFQKGVLGIDLVWPGVARENHHIGVEQPPSSIPISGELFRSTPASNQLLSSIPVPVMESEQQYASCTSSTK